MDIQFRCSNISHFDQATGQYENCGKLMEASVDHVGLKVRCPKCGQTNVVPRPATVGSTGTKVNPGEVLPDDATVEVPVEASAPGMSYTQFSKKTRCRKCGSLLDNEGKCTACYFVAPAMKPATTPIDQIPMQPAGFQLWFQQIMADGIGARMFETAAHSLFTMAMLLCVLGSLALGGEAFVYVLIGVGIVTTIYTLITMQIKRLARVPAARIPFYLRPFWNSLLFFSRLANWQRYDSRLAGRVVIDVRGEAFGDRDLLELEALPACQVLDAQGTDLTDAGLALMHGMKNLRCLVVRRTHVTREGVFRLQQAIPRCWIWY